MIAPEYDNPDGVPIDGDPLRRPPQDDRAARLRVARLDARHLHRRDALLGDDGRGDRRGRRRAPRPDGDAALHRLPRRRLHEPLARDRQAAPTRPSCPRSSGSTGSAATRRTARSCGPASATTAASSSGSSSASRARPTPSRPRSASCPAPGATRHRRPRHEPRSRSPRPLAVNVEDWRAGAAPHRGVVRQVRRPAPRRAARRARRPWRPRLDAS